jgi:oxalate decarboxylase
MLGHVNANEMGYVLEGRILASILDSGSEFSTFAVDKGQMFHIASGSLHYLENLSDSERATVIICFRHERPEDFSLHGSFGAMSNAVLGNTYGLKSAEFDGVKRDTTTKYIVKRKGSADIARSAHLDNPHKFDVEKMSPPVSIDVGSARTARSQFWPALNNMAMYSLRIEEEGMREPHWHPKTGELGFVHEGEARMSVMDPDGSVDTYTLKPGDMYFIPAAYPHQIEVLGNKQIHFLIFFDQPMPYDVGYKASATAISREVMAATFGLDEEALPEFPTTLKDPLIVGRVNSLDPVVELTAMV